MCCAQTAAPKRKTEQEKGTQKHSRHCGNKTSAGQASVKNHGFCCPCHSFVRVGAFAQCCLVCVQKQAKIVVLDLENQARRSHNPSKIEPGAPQDAQKSTKSDNKRSKRQRMRPRSAQERKMEPTWAQHGLTNFRPLGVGGPGGPPLRLLKQVFSAVDKAY